MEVINISDRVLLIEQEIVVSKGLNFNTGCSKKDIATNFCSYKGKRNYK